MKTALVVTLFTLLTSAAFAGNLTCNDTEGVPDHGYALNFSADRAAVEVTTMTIAGPTVVAQLNCRDVDHSGPVHPDELMVVAECFEPFIADGGYSVVVTAGGFTGLTSANLYEVTFVGRNLLTTLICPIQH